VHETENDRWLRPCVVNQKIGKAAKGPKPIPFRRELQSHTPEFGPRLSSAGGGHCSRDQSISARGIVVGDPHYGLTQLALRAARFERQIAMGLVPPGTRLADRDPAAPAWDEVPADQQRLFARHMETYAAMLDCADQNIGRLVARLEELDELGNTILVFSSDNGATNSAGPSGALHFNRRYAGLPALPVEVDVERGAWIGTGRSSAVYPMGWAQVSNAPFPSYKTYTGGGGRRVSFIVSWPDNLADCGAIRSQFAHVIDVMPTLLDLAGVPALSTSHGKPAQPMQDKRR